MSSDAPNIVNHFGILSMASIACAACAVVLLGWYLVKRPPLGRGVRTVLLFGFGIMPIGAAFTANVATYEHTKSREFCGSCHVMEPYAADSADPASRSLPAQHARNPYFGEHNCYVCHADYGMYGTVTTKLAGLRHVWLYVSEWNDYELEEALARIEIAQPYPNQNCMQCHSTEAVSWGAVPEHRATLEEVRAGELSCASPGCHGPAHPFSKEARQQHEAEAEAP